MSRLRQLLGRIGLAFALIVIVSPAVLFFLWMLSLSLKFEVDNASYPPIFIPERFNWGNYSAVLGSNHALVQVALDESVGRITVVSVIDNLAKGTAGGAVQSMNIALGLPEELGLPQTGVAP